MEALITLVAILGYLEIRDRKMKQRFRRDLKHATMKMKALEKEMEAARLASLSLKSLVEEMNSQLQTLAAQTKLVEQTHLNIETILKEYELNGIPMGYIRGGDKRFDAVEGL